MDRRELQILEMVEQDHEAIQEHRTLDQIMVQGHQLHQLHRREGWQDLMNCEDLPRHRMSNNSTKGDENQDDAAKIS